MLSSIKDGYEFERKVCTVLYKTNPYNLSYYDGGPDRGRDICVEYLNNNIKYNVIVECKFHHSGVSKENIMPTLNWATVHHPDLLYFWIVPYLTPAAKDFVQAFEKKYKISVRIEETVNIEEYFKYVNDDDAKIWLNLREKILNSCTNKHFTNYFIPEYEFDKSENSPFLIDRETEREKLLYNKKMAFYLQGVSACGKTQLLKYVAFVYIKKSLPIFWYTIKSGNVKQQCSDFFHTLARYFDSVHQDKTLVEYFETYGYFISQDLENIVVYLLNKYNPILFFDDVHYCQKENVSMRILFKKLIKYQICRMYFAGWFNIFDFFSNEKGCITTIILEGMKKKELDLIIQHYSGECNPAVAELIEQHFYGLPGYAVLANKEMIANDIKGANDFLAYFLTLLSPEEQIVLFTLSLLSTDVQGDFLVKQGYAMQLVSLENKHLLIARRHCYTVHDKYRTFFSRCTIKESILSKVTLLMEKYATLQPSAFLDLINFRLFEKNYIIAWHILSTNFQLLVVNQFYTEVLKQLQEIELKTQGEININDIILKKIVLLERLGKYDICLQYIRLFDDTNLFNQLDQETIFYIQLRCLYFTNKYDDILELYNDNYLIVENYTDRDIYIQILLIIGRVFYIRGSSNGAIIYYLLAYQQAHKLHKKSSEVKAIHRIAMVERRLGLVFDSRKTFQELLKLDALITPKRRSYIYYRIAKCFYNEGNLKEAKDYNKKSIKIKKSYNDTRGLLFSESLSAMICLKEKDYLGAYYHSTKACKYADSLKLHKEWLTAVLVKVSTTLQEMSNNSNVSDINSDLQRGLKIAIEEKLLLRLITIEKLTEEYWPDLCLIARQNIDKIKEELQTAEKKLFEYYIQRQNLNLKQNYETLIIHKKSISQSLLLRSGFLDPILICQ